MLIKIGYNGTILIKQTEGVMETRIISKVEQADGWVMVYEQIFDGNAIRCASAGKREKPALRVNMPLSRPDTYHVSDWSQIVQPWQVEALEQMMKEHGFSDLHITEGLLVARRNLEEPED
jgi:hypothetical protein